MRKGRKVWGVVLASCMAFSGLGGMSMPLYGQSVGGIEKLELQCEYMKEPLGIDVINPRFNFKMISSTRGQKQTAYQIVVKDSQGDVVWDTGKVMSNQSVGITYQGESLKSRMRYTWQVTVWDKDHRPFTSSESWFEMGLLEQTDWEAQFIAVDEQKEERQIESYKLEMDFTIEQDGAGIIFGYKDSGNFLMWQINTYDYAESKQVYFRPHRWVNGGPGVIVEKDISQAIPWEKKDQTHHLEVVVTETNEVVTSINGIEIDRRTEALASFGEIGFRQCKSVNVSEGAYFDNIVITDTGKEVKEVIFNEDFEKGINPFSKGEIKEGQLFAKNTDIFSKNVLKQDEENSAPMFRKEFVVDPNKTLKQARLYASALGVYEAYINGEKVGKDKLAPGWTDYTQYVMYQTFDVTDLLQSGSNALGSMVADGWYAGHVSTGGGNFNKYGVDVAFVGQLELEYTDGTREVIATDETWQSSKQGPILLGDNQDGETYDARKEMIGWDEPNFDSSSWAPTKIATQSTINTKCDVENIKRIAQIGPAVEMMEDMPVIEVTEPKPGVFVCDIGQNIAGWARIKVKGEEGNQVRLRFGEMLYDERYEDQAGMIYTENLRTAKATDYYTLKGDSEGEIYEPRFTFHGFRYIEITGYPGNPTKEDIKNAVTGVVVGSNTEPVGNFETSHAMVNQLYSNIVWGQRGNFLSIPTDCPQRDERLGWTGDAQVFARTATLNMDVNQFFSKYLLDVETAQRSNGAIYDIAPAQGHAVGAGNAGWGDVAVVMPWVVYTTYGDTKVIEDSYDMMKKWISYYKDVAATPGTLIIPNCAYGDWLAIGEDTPKDVISTAYFAYSTHLLSKMAAVIGQTEDAAYYKKLFEDIREQFNSHFVDQTTGVIKGNSQTAYLLALQMELLPTEELREKATDQLINRLAANNWHLSTGFLGVSYLCPVLSERGYSDIAYKLLLNETYPSWGYSVVNGATTIWERWNSYTKENGFGPVEMNSFNHYSYGSIGEWMFRYSAGIELDEANPGYKHIIIQPEPNESMSYVKASYDSVYGEITNNWTLNNQIFGLKTTIPANTTATVYLPSDDVQLKVDGIAYLPGTTQIEGVTYKGKENGKTIFDIESGSYTFESYIAEEYTLTIEREDEFVKARVSVNDKMMELPYVGKFKEGEAVSLEVVPINEVDYAFVKWSGDMNTDQSKIDLTVSGDINLQTHYAYKGGHNIAIGKGVTAQSQDGGAPAWSLSNLTDGLYISTGAIDQGIKGYTSKGFKSQDVSAEPQWVEIDLGQDTSFNTVKLYPRTDSLAAGGGMAGFPQDFSIQVRNEREDTYKVVYEESGCTAPSLKPYSITLDGEQSARYVRLNVTHLGDMAIDDKVYRLQLAEMGIYKSSMEEQYTLQLDALGEGTIKVNGVKVELPYQETYPRGTQIELAVEKAIGKFEGWTGGWVSKQDKVYLELNDHIALTAHFQDPSSTNFAHNQKVIYNDSISAGTAWRPSNLTDGNKTGTGFSTNGDLKVPGDKWVGVELTEQSLVDTIILYPRTDGTIDANGQTPSYPVDFTIEVKNDKDTEFQVIQSITNQSNPNGEPQIYTFEEPVDAQSVRVYVTKLGTKDPQDVEGARVQLAEMEIYNKHYPQYLEVTTPSQIQINQEVPINIEFTLAVTDKKLDAKPYITSITSSNTEVAVLTEEGNIKAVAEGIARINVTAEVNGMSYTYTHEIKVVSEETDRIVETVLSGPGEVQGGNTFEILLGVDKINGTLYATDVVVDYDRDKLKLNSVIGIEPTLIVGEKEEEGLRLLTSMEKGIVDFAYLLKFEFKTAPTDMNHEVKVDVISHKLGLVEDGEAKVEETNQVSKIINIKGIPVEVTEPEDINGDKVINVADLALVAYYYRAEVGDGNWAQAKIADVNLDNVVDILDLIQVAQKVMANK